LIFQVARVNDISRPLRLYLGTTYAAHNLNTIIN
jgi:hypothetical protein